MTIAVISDTHDLLRPEVLDRLRGCGCILHCGDISSRRILDQLEAIAPVRVVRGNNDKDWVEDIPCTLDFELGGLRICMAHRKKDLPKDLSAYDLAVCGHTHRYDAVWLDCRNSRESKGFSGCKRDGKKRTLLLNPGSCGPRLFHQPITMAVLTIEGDGFTAERIEIPHPTGGTALRIDSGNIRQQIGIVIRETQKGQTTDAIARKYGMDSVLAEQIARLYVTHPGVTVDGIMTKMGL